MIENSGLQIFLILAVFTAIVLQNFHLFSIDNFSMLSTFFFRTQDVHVPNASTSLITSVNVSQRAFLKLYLILIDSTEHN